MRRGWSIARRRTPASPNGSTEIGRSAAGKALKRLLAASPKLEALLAGLADGSPFLWDLATAEPAAAAGRCSIPIPTSIFAALLAKAEQAVAATKDEAEAMRLLRRMKAEAALLIALADIGGVWPVMRATRALTELADTADRRRGALPAARCRRPRPAQAGRSGAARGGQRPHRARHGQDGRLRAQLFERHRPDRVLRPGRAGAGRQGRRHGVPCADHARPGEAPAGAHRRRLRVPRRSAAAARSGLDPDRGLDRGRARTTTAASARTGSARR